MDDTEDSGSSDIEIIEISETARREGESVASCYEKGDAAMDREANDNGSMQKGSRSQRALKSLVCPICLETPEIVAVATCGHIYCHECIFTSLSSARTANNVTGACSICRQKVRYDQVLYMEFKVREDPSSRENM